VTIYYSFLNSVVHGDDIICVLNADNATAGRYTREFLKRREQNGELFSAEEEPRNIIVIERNGKEFTYFTQTKPKPIINY